MTALPLTDADTHRLALDCFTGEFAPKRVTLLYQAGLAVVAFAMVLLPAIYIALILLTGSVVVWHVSHNTWIFDDASAGRGTVGRLILYCGPAVAIGKNFAIAVVAEAT